MDLSGLEQLIMRSIVDQSCNEGEALRSELFPDLQRGLELRVYCHIRGKIRA